MHAHGNHVRSWPSAFCHRFKSMHVNDVVRVVHVPRESWAWILLDYRLQRWLFRRTICAQMANFAACPARTLVAIHDSLLALVGWMFSATVIAFSARARISVDSVDTRFSCSVTFSN